MTLAKELAETNAILRQAAQPPKVEEEPERRSPRQEPERLRASEILVSVREAGAILREHFKDVPPRFWEMAEDKSRTVTCLCSEQTTIPFGGLHRCKCQRIFWNGETLKAAPAPEPEDIVVCDWTCGEDLKLGEGRWVRFDGDGREMYVCQRCAPTVPGEML